MSVFNCVTLALLGFGLVSGPVVALFLQVVWWPSQDRAKETLRIAQAHHQDRAKETLRIAQEEAHHVA